jgi:hypothetical protein
MVDFFSNVVYLFKCYNFLCVYRGRALCMLGKHSTIKLYPQPQVLQFLLKVTLIRKKIIVFKRTL